MPRQSHSYRLHSKSGQAFVEINGKRTYLGKHGSEASLEAYRKLITQHRARQRAQEIARETETPDHGITVTELIDHYRKHVSGYYIKDGVQTSEVDNIRQAVRPLRETFGDVYVSDFGPKLLKAVRERMIEAGRSRPTINRDIKRIRAMFKWGVAEELVSPMVLHGLQAVAALTRGRTVAREPEPVEPVPIEIVEATLPYLAPPLAAMVRLQLLTGARPGEITILRPEDITLADGVMVYRPASHKTQHRGKERRIFLGPQAQEILRPYLDRGTRRYCFDPREVVAAWMAEKRENRKTKGQPSQICRAKRNPSNARQAIRSVRYRRAIARGCRRAAKNPRVPRGRRANCAHPGSSGTPCARHLASRPPKSC
ncbi:MAG: site-specific integrase [Planctomycetota bacterium]